MRIIYEIETFININYWFINLKPIKLSKHRSSGSFKKYSYLKFILPEKFT